MLVLTIPGRLGASEVSDFAEASAKYRALQEGSQEGASTFPEGRLTGTGLYRISYNGRVWENDGVLVYCPASAPMDQGQPAAFNQGRESVWGRKVPNSYAVGTEEYTIFELGAEYARRLNKGN